MSARKAIEDLLWWSVPGADNEESKRLAAWMLDAYRDEVAHGLAEKIRREAGELDGWPETRYAMNKAADLIDPGVE